MEAMGLVREAQVLEATLFERDRRALVVISSESLVIDRPLQT